MDEKMLENEVRDEVQNMLGWMKVNKKDNEQEDIVKHGHCNGFSSHCCLSCDRCWGQLK